MMNKIQEQFKKETGKPITVIGKFNSNEYPIVEVSIEIWNSEYIDWLEKKVSEQQK